MRRISIDIDPWCPLLGRGAVDYPSRRGAIDEWPWVEKPRRMADLLIKGSLIVDGTGAPGRIADLAVTGGRITGVGDLGGETAGRVVDGTGLVTAPGFVDLHTHYDAQLFWDPTASPSPLHGVTTVFGGNCGFTLAPAGEAHAPYLMEMMARVEGMPLEALQAGLTWDWGRFPRLAQPARRGDRRERRVPRRSLRGPPRGDGRGHARKGRRRGDRGDGADRAGRLRSRGHGVFSTSTSPTHNDAEGNPVPSRAASTEELVALAAAAGAVPGTTLEMVLAGTVQGFTDEERELMGAMSVAANRPLNWNVLGVSAMNPDGHLSQLAASDHAAAMGGRVVALTMPHTMKIRLSFHSGFILDGMPDWAPVMGLPVDERLVALRDPDVRARLQAGATSEEAGVLRGLANWERLQIVEAFTPDTKAHEGKTVRQVMDESGNDDAFDALLEIVLADGLKTGLSPSGMEPGPADWETKAEVWKDPRTIVGASDAGAHLDMMCGAIYSTSLLGDGVREHQVISLEEAVQQLTDIPARLYGLDDRGRIEEGFAADLTVFDPETVGHLPARTRADLPGGAWRLYCEATGVEHVFVNGTAIVEAGEFTGDTPGTLLRSGVDTTTVTP